jgi:hypothetical protein
MRGTDLLMWFRPRRCIPVKLVVLLLSVLLLSACSEGTVSIKRPPQLTGTSQSALEPSLSTSQPAETTGPAPLTEATPAIIIEPSEPAATPTVGPPAFGVPLEELVFFAPGPGSFAVNAVRVNGYGGPSLNNRVQLTLYGEDGRKLSEGYAWLYSYPGTPGNFYATMPFEISLVAEMGWLQVCSYGDRYGNLRHANTIGITLLSESTEKIYPGLHGSEQLSIFSPHEEAIVEGGTVHVEGAGWVDHEGPIIVQVLDHSGKVLGSAETEIDTPVKGHITPFSVDVKYQVAYPQWARIGVAEPHPVINGPSHYASVEVWLRP